MDGAVQSGSALVAAGGFIINGALPSDRSGSAIARVGDVNGDGLADLPIGAPGNSPGQAYLVLGSRDRATDPVDLGSLEAGAGIAITPSEALGEIGSTLAAVGDVKGDGPADFALAAPNADAGGLEDSGATCIIFGRSDGFPAGIDLAALDGSIDLAALDGGNGFAVHGPTLGAYGGSTVTGLGDVSGDGIDDLLISAAGRGHVILGTAGGLAPTLKLAELDGTNGFILGFTDQLINAGDLNGDGLTDFLVAGEFAQNYYLVFGRATGLPADLDLTSLDGQDGFLLRSSDASSWPLSAAAAGDVNGDGLDDLIIGDPHADGGPYSASGSGRVWVVFGRSSGFGAELTLESLDGTNGFAIAGIQPGGRGRRQRDRCRRHQRSGSMM